MNEENKIQNEEEITTPAGTDQPAEQIDSEDDKSEEEKVEISIKELGTYKKKAEDFDAMIVSKRLAKLQKQETPNENNNVDVSELVKKIEDLENIVKTNQVSSKNTLLEDGYKQFISENKWADNDDIFSKISENFDASEIKTKEEVVLKLKSIAVSKFPNEYENSLTAKAKAQALAEAGNINAGGGSSGSDSNHFAGTGKSEEDKMSEKFMKNFPIGWAINKK